MQQVNHPYTHLNHLMMDAGCSSWKANYDPRVSGAAVAAAAVTASSTAAAAEQHTSGNEMPFFMFPHVSIDTRDNNASAATIAAASAAAAAATEKPFFKFSHVNVN